MSKANHPSHEQFLESCNAVARQRLLNRRIVEVRYLNTDECRELMWDFTGLALVLDDGTTVYSGRDAEGNGPGALHGVAGDGQQFVIPPIFCPA